MEFTTEFLIFTSIVIFLKLTHNVLWLCEVWGKPSQFLIFSLMFPSTRPIFH